jgi:23S rRNA pseudouridine1911/1915/1917 synthase
MRFIATQPIALLEALELMSPDSSKNTLRSWLEKERVTVNGKLTKQAKFLVSEGQEVCVGRRMRFLREEIKILFEDEHLVVIDKPEGLLSVATDFDKSQTAHTILKRRFNNQKVYPVHRLDRETSGVMVFAYSEVAKEGLKELFFKHDIEREYSAIVEGVLKEPTGTWQSYLKEDEAYYVKSIKNPELGKHAITHYEVLSHNKNFSLIKLRLETGRKNQIRVHCKENGHPIVGDKKYGAQTVAGRLCLHASKLGFVHPATGKKLSFESLVPELFDKFVHLLPKR